jgi:hypothetical protein
MYATEVLSKFSATLPMAASIRSPVVNLVVIRQATCQNIHTICRCNSVDANSVSVEGDVFSVTSSSKSDFDYLGESTKGDLNLKLEHLQAFGILFSLSIITLQFSLFFLFLKHVNVGIDGHETLEGPIEEVARVEAKEAEDLLRDLGIPVQ